MNYLDTSADISDCQQYRYRLRRRWKKDGSICTFILLNPSTADGTEDDPTIRRCVGFADAWGHSGVNVVNLFAYRATNPKNLKQAADPIGPENDTYLRETLQASESAVAGWGEHGAFMNRGQEVQDLCAAVGIKLQALKINQSGQPAHPLYLPADSALQRL